MAYKIYTKEESKEQIKILVDQFHEDFLGKKNPQMKEAQLEDKYIKPFFSYLNWNIHNEGIGKGREEFRVQTSHRMNKTVKEPDYELWLPEKETQKMKRYLFMEAKNPKYDLKKEVGYMRQAYQYAHSTLNLSDHSTNRTRLSLLTDFEEFRLFDCFNPHPLTTDKAAAFNKYIVSPFDFYYTEYESNFNIIWDTFERVNVYNGSLNKFQVTDEELKKNRIAPDLKFLDDLKKWRLDFARSMYKSNKEVSDEFLTSASQLLINRIIFIKMLTDRDIEDDCLTQILDRLKKDKEEISIYDSCRGIFQNLDKRYNGDIFKRRGEFDFVKIENKIFKQVIESLRPEKSVYTLAAMPIEIIGNAYEQFLGEIIVHKGRGLTSEQKPEVQKAGGVYYTPRYVVDYIVQNTVGEKLKEFKKPNDVENIKILDPACGSGSFLIGAYDCFLEWYLNYYKTEVDKMLKKGGNESEIKKKFRDSIKIYSIDSDEESNRYIIHLTSKIKKQILSNNIYGVDIDGNAVEITKFSLSMKSLENSTKDELYEDVDLFNEKLLPELKDNIKCGNSLIGNDFYDDQLDLFPEQMKKINAFDWEEGFPEIFNQGGFDAVIGNPPYVLGRETFENETKEYFASKYMSYGGKFDLYVYFTEKALSILTKKGRFGFIIPNTILVNENAAKLRKRILNFSLETIRIFDYRVFQKAQVETVILIASHTTPSKTHRIIIESDKTYELQQAQFNADSDYRFNVLLDEDTISLINKMNAKSARLGDISDICIGIQLGGSGTKKESFIGPKKIDNSWKKVLDGKNINTYSLNWPNMYVRYGDWLHRKRNVKYFLNPKILIRQIGEAPVATYDDKSYYALNTLYCLISKSDISLKFVLAIMNCKLGKWFWLKHNSDFKTIFPKIKKPQIESIPIVNASTSDKNYNAVIKLVDNLLKLNKQLQTTKLETQRQQIQRTITHIEKKIDELVYRLYGLNKKEIEIIENS